MSLWIDLHINENQILAVGITREDGSISNGTDPDAVSIYRWVYHREPGKPTIGHVEHRYGDGATALAAKVLAAIAEHQATA